MNLLGKVFVILILVMSLIFMAFAVGVYATHQNWYVQVKKTQSELQAANTDKQQLTQQLANLTEQLDSELAARREAVAKLETEKEQILQQVRGLQQKEDQLVEGERRAVAAMETTQQSLAALRGEVDALRQSIRQTQTEKEENFQQVVKLTDELNQAQTELSRVNERNLQLTEQTARMKTVLELHDLDEFEPTDGQPPKVDGVVLASSSDGMVEISLGSDDGIRRGNQLEVYRLGPDVSKYLGRIEVIRTAPDKSVAKIIPEFRKGVIEKEDRVATRLR
ncbi:MAG: hypothetical protein K1X74_01465 [Pirellulales bacterium]|nr:hypothetical protein [Pirellulales bacterium]